MTEPLRPGTPAIFVSADWSKEARKRSVYPTGERAGGPDVRGCPTSRIGAPTCWGAQLRLVGPERCARAGSGRGTSAPRVTVASTAAHARHSDGRVLDSNASARRAFRTCSIAPGTLRSGTRRSSGSRRRLPRTATCCPERCWQKASHLKGRESRSSDRRASSSRACCAMRRSRSRRLPAARTTTPSVLTISCAIDTVARTPTTRTTVACDLRCRNGYRWSTCTAWFRGDTSRPGPCFVVGDHREGLTFTVAVDEERHRWPAAHQVSPAVRDDAEGPRRRYATAAVQQRLHQRAFRERVLDAYRQECAFWQIPPCRAARRGAHCARDRPRRTGGDERLGAVASSTTPPSTATSWVSGQTTSCRYVPDLLDEEDGPTLVHGIQALHGARLRVPRRSVLQPDRQFLEIRYRTFRRA